MVLPLVADMLTLVAVYQGTGGSEWYNSEGWLVGGVPPCQWHGITCNDDMGISAIDLSQNNLQGSMPLEVWQIPSLESISLAENPQLEVQFGVYQEVTSPLRSINISYTATTSLKGLEQVHSSLESLDISATNVTEPDLGPVLALHNLTHLSMNLVPLGSNDFFARQLINAGKLPLLQTLSIARANIPGTLPVMLGTYTSLQVLDLSFNAFTGSLPVELLHLADLRVLRLQSQQQPPALPQNVYSEPLDVTDIVSNATGVGGHTGGYMMTTSRARANPEAASKTKTGLSGPLLDFRHCSQLSLLDLSNNQLQGEIPGTFLAGLPVYPAEPLIVNLRNNVLVGRLPEALARFGFLNMDVTDNQISVIPSAYCDQTTWMDGLVGKVGCNAILCPPGTYNEHGRQTTVRDECIACSVNRTEAWFSTSDYYGSIECSTIVAFAQEHTLAASEAPLGANETSQQPDEMGQATAQNTETNQQQGQARDTQAPVLDGMTQLQQADKVPDATEDQGQQQDESVQFAREKNNGVDLQSVNATDETLLVDDDQVLQESGTVQQVQPLQEGSEEIQGKFEIWTSLYQATGGENWWKSDGWLDESVPLCEWHGIGCSDDGLVVELFLGHNGLVGTIPPEFFRLLPDLQWIDFHSNPQLNIDLSQAGPVNNSNIEALLLAETATTSVAGVATVAPQLRRLDLNSTQVTSDTVSDVFELYSIEILHMGDNNLESIPETVADAWTNLRILTAPRCGLTGTIPARIGELTNLKYVDLSDNRFLGPIPASLGHMMSLEHLNLRSQLKLTGPLLSFEGVPLLYLDLSLNQLTSTIPANFLGGANQSDSIVVDLRGNYLTGEVPLELARFSSLQLDLTSNRIDYLDPQFCDAKAWMGGLVAAFSCDAIMCSPGTFSPYGRMLSDSVPCRRCNAASEQKNKTEQHSDVYGSTACVGGGIPVPAEGSSLSSNMNISDREILELLWMTTGGSSWVNADNWLQESSDICEWYGIECTNSGIVKAIVLDNNNLVGTSPFQLFHMAGLERLYLNDNENLVVNFSGIGLRGESVIRAIVAPNTATYSTQGLAAASSTLQVLDLSSTRVTSQTIDDVFTLSSLQRLNLERTIIRGVIAPAIGHLTELTEFRAPNCLISGTLPAEVGLLTKLSVLDLSRNGLIGLLPTSLSGLAGLKVLDLSYNQNLRGRLIPFENLQALTELDLSGNDLIGSIPSNFLSGVLDKLTRIEVNMSRNSLTGTVPESLVTFENLNFDATGNLITSLPEVLCYQSSWMLGDVGTYGCDGILCPPSTYNRHGRQVSVTDPCVPCFVNTQPFFGEMECLEKTEDVHGPANECPDIDGIPYAGSNCQYPATSICSLEGPYISFCTNGGGCVALVDQGADHGGCLCQEGFSGAYCEITDDDSGGNPNAAMTDGPESDDQVNWHWAIWIGIPVLAICIVLGIIGVAYSRNRKQASKKKFLGQQYASADDANEDVERGLPFDSQGAPSAISVDTSGVPDVSNTLNDEDDDLLGSNRNSKEEAAEFLVDVGELVAGLHQSSPQAVEVLNGETAQDTPKKPKRLRFADDVNGYGDIPVGDNAGDGNASDNGEAEGTSNISHAVERTEPKCSGLLGQEFDGFIGDINETESSTSASPESPEPVSPPRPVGRSLLKGGVQEDDSVSVTESVGMIDSDSERSFEGKARTYVSVPPSLAATMFAVQEVSETSSGDVSLNF